MKLKTLKLSAIAAAIIFFLPCCSDDNNDNPEEPEGEEDVKNTLDPSESKEYLEETANLFLNKFKAADQAELMNLAKNFIDNYGEYDMPDEYYDDEEDSPVWYMMKKIQKAISENDYFDLTRASSDLIYNFKKYSGHFEADSENYEWVKVSDSEDIVFTFFDEGENCVVTAVAEGSEWNGSYSDEYDTWTIQVPEKVIVSLIKGSSTLFTSTIVSEYSKSARKAKVNVVVTAANIGVTTVTDISDTVITEKQSLSVSNESILASNATIEGANLCNQDEIENLIENGDEDSLDKYFSKGYATVNILGRVIINGNIVKLGKVIDALDYDDDKDGAETAANQLNNYISGEFSYSGSDVRQGIVQLEAYREDYDEYYDYEYWTLRPILTFDSDKSSYSFEEYFGKGKFANVEDLFEDLFDDYENYWE